MFSALSTLYLLSFKPTFGNRMSLFDVSESLQKDISRGIENADEMLGGILGVRHELIQRRLVPFFRFSANSVL